MKAWAISYMKKILLLIVLYGLSYLAVNGYIYDNDRILALDLSYRSNTEDIFQVFYAPKDADTGFNESMSITAQVRSSNYYEKVSFALPIDTEKVRIDFGTKASTIDIHKIEIRRIVGKKIIEAQDILEDTDFNDYISSRQLENDALHITTLQGDPYIKLKKDISVYTDEIERQIPYYIVIYSVISAFVLYLLIGIAQFAFRIRLLKHIRIFLKDIFTARMLILKLAVNDFKTKYAGSYFGILWAFAQPIITILTFWFVFQVGFRSAPVQDYPFILWFICGIIPWFFFADATTNAMYSLIEYNYLVKKIVFKISILPLIKVISSLFVHLFFIFFIFAAFVICGYLPNIYNIQVAYYLICLFIISVSMSFITSSIIIFFKDFGQIISILLQIGMWFTPIMWSYKMVPSRYDLLFKLNPMFYIVEGYRDSFIQKVWFFEKANLTCIFWITTVLLFLIGTYLFKKLKPHFSDVL